MKLMRRSLFLAVATTAFAVAGLACNRSGAKLRDAASEDLNCPPADLHILGASRTKDVNGCGHTATYNFQDGDWTMVTRDGAPIGPAARPSTLKGPPAVTPAQAARIAHPVNGTPSMPPSSPPPPPPAPPAAGQKAL